MHVKPSVISPQILYTGERVIASNLLIYGYTLLNYLNIIKNIIKAGIMTINAGQLTHAIDIIIPSTYSAVFMVDYAYSNTV